MITTILFIIIGLCIVGLATIVLRKFPLLAQVEVATLSQEKEVSLKKKLLEERFMRKLSSVFLWVGRLVLPISKKIVAEFHRWLEVVTRREQKTRIQKLKSQNSGETGNADPGRFLREVDSLIESGRTEEAESRLVEFIALNPRDVQSYKRLAELAVEKKENEQAKEIYEFIIKLDDKSQTAYSGLGKIFFSEGEVVQAQAAIEKSVALHSKNPYDYYTLAKIYQTTGDSSRALDLVRRACELQPQNPKFLDKLAEIAILEKRKILAKNTYLKLKEVNAENEKLPELKRQIDALK